MIKGNSSLAFTILLLLSLFFASCRSARFLNDEEALVTSVHIQGVDAKLKESAFSYISNEIRPNSRVNFFIYNLYNTKNGAYKTSHIRAVGEPPRLVDSALIDLSSTQIKRFLVAKGYFHAQVNPEIKIVKKRAHINFHVQTGTPYLIGTIERQFADTTLQQTFEKPLALQSKLKEGKKYDASDLLQERENLYSMLRNKGYYDYVRQYMRVLVDTNKVANRADLKIIVDNPTGKNAHTIYTIDSVSIHITNPVDKQLEGSQYTRVKKDKFTYFDETGKFRLRPLTLYTYLNAGDRYSLSRETLSYDRLYELNGFRSVKVQYQKVDSAKLHMAYALTPRPAMGNQVEGEFTLSSGLNGLNVGNTFSHRNIFGGAEQLEVKLRYGVLFDSKIPGSLSQKIFNNDFQIGVNLVIPRLVAPVSIRGIANYGLPKTTISTSLQIFNQDLTYANRYLINTLNYAWYETANKYHSLTPIVVEYRQGKLNEAFAADLIDRGYLLYVRSNNREYFGLGAQYAFTYNASKLNKQENFHYFKGAVDLSGNLLDLVSKVANFKENEVGEKDILGVPYLQYAKTELDFRMYKHFGGSRQLVLRFNSGIAIPYGNNSSLLIFEKSFYGGGMNGIRAWQVRTLGPGNYNRADLDESLRLNFRNLDQLGEIKIEGNIEYRFQILNNFLGAKMKGATFLDFGNIWRLKENVLNPGGEFHFNKFLNQFAIGSGFGLRFDSGYFIIRMDAGLKVKDPQFQGSKQWVIQHLFNQRAFKNEYNATHRPDRYNFIQYNFGIGLPF